MTKVVRFLMVDDDQDMLGFIIEYMRRVFADDGVQTEIIGVLDGETALKMLLDEGPFDLLLSDVSLPGMNGLEMLRLARDHGVSTPALFLTAHDALSEKEAGFQAGADDYLAKPYSPRELEYRIKALLLKRSTDGQPVSSPESIKVGDLVIDKRRLEVLRAGERMELTPLEFQLLELLASEPGRAWSRNALLDRIWSTDYEGYQRNIDPHINRLRKKIETDPKNPRYVLTVRGVGYKLNDIL